MAVLKKEFEEMQGVEEKEPYLREYDPEKDPPYLTIPEIWQRKVLARLWLAHLGRRWDNGDDSAHGMFASSMASMLRPDPKDVDWEAFEADLVDAFGKVSDAPSGFRAGERYVTTAQSIRVDYHAPVILLLPGEKYGYKSSMSWGAKANTDCQDIFTITTSMSYGAPFTILKYVDGRVLRTHGINNREVLLYLAKRLDSGDEIPGCEWATEYDDLDLPPPVEEDAP